MAATRISAALSHLLHRLCSPYSHFLTYDATFRPPVPCCTAGTSPALPHHTPDTDGHPTQALALLAQPSNSPAALRLLSQLLDTICYAAGDTSTDGSWYTKRAALAAVYTSTELYMLTDYSPGVYVWVWVGVFTAGVGVRSPSCIVGVAGGMIRILEEGVMQSISFIPILRPQWAGVQLWKLLCRTANVRATCSMQCMLGSCTQKACER